MRQLERNNAHFWFVAIAFLGSLLLFFLRYGYNFGGADHDELLSLVYKIQDPQLFSKDAFFTSSFDLSNVRFFSTYFFLFFSHLFGNEGAALFIYLLAWLSIVTSLYFITYYFTKSQWASALTVIVSLALTHKNTLGHNDFVYIQYTPEMLAWALCTWGIYFALDRKTLPLSALFLGIATLIHPVLGLAHFMLWLIWQAFLQMRNLRLLFLPSILYLAFALYVLIPQLLNATQNPTTIFQLITQIRLGVHFNFSIFGWTLVIKFFILTVIGGIAWVMVWGELMASYRKQIRIFLLLIVGLCVFAFLASLPIFATTPFYKFQFWKLTVWFKFFMVMGLVYAVLFWSWNHTHAIANAPFFCAVLFVLCGATLYGIQNHHFYLTHQYQGSQTHLSTHLGQMEAWISKNTPKEALFVIPPSQTTFRTFAQRSVYVTWLAFPFAQKEMIEWKSRMDVLTQLPNTLRWTASKTDEAFYTVHNQKWNLLKAQTQANFLLLERPKTDIRPLKPVKQIGNWVLVK